MAEHIQLREWYDFPHSVTVPECSDDQIREALAWLHREEVPGQFTWTGSWVRGGQIGRLATVTYGISNANVALEFKLRFG